MSVRALSRRQRELQDRDATILTVTRDLILAEGYFGVTMDRIAEACECPKGTLYHRFASKEEIIMLLALQASQRRLAMMRRGGAFRGRTRERLVGISEGASLFLQMELDDARLIRMAWGPVFEKASPQQLAAIHRVEHDTLWLFWEIVAEAVREGDLPQDSAPIERIAFGLTSLLDGASGLTESQVPQEALRIVSPVHEVWCVYNTLLDAYRWRPLFDEQDWEDTLADIRRTVFPEEAQRLYGKGCWYGANGRVNPNQEKRASS